MYFALMSFIALQGVSERPPGELASTFGVDWVHLAAQSVSFGIVCLVLYALAYKPVLRVLETRREQIAAGLANAKQIKAELARIDVERHVVLARAAEEGKRLVEEARTAAARIRIEQARKATVEAEQILARAKDAAARERALMLAQVKREVGRLVVKTTASVTGKILTAEDHRRLATEAASRLTPQIVARLQP